MFLNNKWNYYTIRSFDGIPFLSHQMLKLYERFEHGFSRFSDLDICVYRVIHQSNTSAETLERLSLCVCIHILGQSLQRIRKRAIRFAFGQTWITDDQTLYRLLSFQLSIHISRDNRFVYYVIVRISESGFLRPALT